MHQQNGIQENLFKIAECLDDDVRKLLKSNK